MAEEPTKPAEQVVAVAEERVTEKPVSEKEPAEPVASTEEVVEVEKPKDDVVAVEEEKITQSVSFKEESNVVGELPEAQKKALEELKNLIQDAFNKHDFTVTSAAKEEEKPAPPASEEPKVEPEKAETEKAETVTSVVSGEEKKEEEKPASEEPKIEEKAETEAVTSEAPDEEKKEVEEKAETVVVTEVVEKVADVDEDGAKTVEAIQESIVSVSTIEKTEEQAAPPSNTVDEAAPAEAEAEHKAPEEVSIWGIPLLADERSDVILLKFLRARDFKVKEAFTMIKNTVRWRKEFGIDALVEEDLGNDWDKVVFTHGYDKKGHPVCYNVFGEFENKELYQNTFSDEEKRQKFIRWRIQFLEKSVRKFDFTPTGVSTIFQVNDLKNSPGLLITKKELRQSTDHALQLLQDNYPEFVAKQVPSFTFRSLSIICLGKS